MASVPYNSGSADSSWLQSVLNGNGGGGGLGYTQGTDVGLSPHQLFRPGAFDNMSQYLDRSLHVTPGVSSNNFNSGTGYTYDATMDALASAYENPYTHEASQTDLYARGSFLAPMNEETAFGTTDIRSILICGPPGSGKTSLVKNVLHRNAIRMDAVFVATKTQESIYWFESGVPRGCVANDTDPEMLMELMDMWSNYYEVNQRKAICAVVIDDILVAEKDSRSNTRLWLNEYIKRAHRAGILLIVACHRARCVSGQIAGEFSIKMQCGKVEDYPDMIKEYYSMFCTTRWPNYEDFKEVYSKAVAGPGQCFVLQSRGTEDAVSYWHPEEMKEPIVFGHRDWWISWHMWGKPMRYYIVDTNENGEEETRWVYCGPTSSNGLDRALPSLDTLRRQQAGIDVEKEMSQLIAIQTPSSSTSKKGAKRTSIRRF